MSFMMMKFGNSYEWSISTSEFLTNVLQYGTLQIFDFFTYFMLLLTASVV